MSVRMLSRPTSIGSTQQPPASQQQATPSVPSLLSNSSGVSLAPVSTYSSPPPSPIPAAFPVPPSLSPASALGPSPSPRVVLFSSANDPSSVTDVPPSTTDGPSSYTNVSANEIPGLDPERSSGPKIVLPPSYEVEDCTDPKQVVVIGVISRLEDEASQLLDRILLAQVFSVNKCASSWERRNQQENKETVRAPNPNSHGDDQDGPALSGSPLETETGRPIFKGHDAVKAKSQSKGKAKLDGNEDPTLHRTGDTSRGDQYSAPKSEYSQADGQQGARYAETRERNEKKSFGRGTGREREWIDGKLKNYYDGEKGVLYVQYVWGSLPRACMREEERAGEGLAEALERHEADSFRGLLFMFSVCHIILIVQEGSRFDPRYLRTFRTLQAAKHALAPYVKTQVLPGVLPPSTNRPSQPLRSGSTPSQETTGRNGVVLSTARQNSSIGFMSGSTPVLYPGQCTPVILFVCLEEFFESATATGSNASGIAAEGAIETPGTSGSLQTGPVSSVSPRSAHSRLPKSSQLTPLLARPGSKTEAGFRKKMQSSTETQIRFLLKKCRTLASVAGEGGSTGSAAAAGMGLRGLAGGVSSLVGGSAGGALFALDQSRAVVFVDRAANRPGAGLEELSDVLFNFMRSMGGPDGTLNLTGLSEPMGEDMQAIKDFLLKHTEILRGRGGTTSSAAGSSGGAGMVAAAAAAAAASTSGGASGATKPLHNPPELPTVAAWFSACQILADGLTSAWENRGNTKFEKVEPTTAEKVDLLRGQESSFRKVVRRYSQMSTGTMNANATGGTSSPSTASRQRVTSLEGVISSLESAIDIDLQFSTAWCERVLPSAHEAYLRDLPSSYPTVVHTAHLEKSLRVFHNMVRGPAVPRFVEKLTASCEAIWRAGRQLCDAVSLTGKSCIHHVHEVAENKVQERITKGTEKKSCISKPHSSGVVFLHACACGRSRKLRKDPFDYESANVTFFHFPNCEDMLPSLALPASTSDNLLGGSVWNLVRLGSARYYQPSVGLMQIGFIPDRKYLSPWDIEVVHESNTAAVSSTVKEDAVTSKTHRAGTEPEPSIDAPKVLLLRPQTGSVDAKQGTQPELSLYRKVAEKGPSFESSGMSMKVTSSRSDRGKMIASALSKANYGGDSAFPPLPQKISKPVTPSKPPKPTLGGKERLGLVAPDLVQVEVRQGGDTLEGSPKLEEGLASLKIDAEKEETDEMSDTVLINGVKVPRIQSFRVYVGFEHECPRGHRFFISVKHVQSFGVSYPQPDSGTPELDPDWRSAPMKEQPMTTGTTLGAAHFEKKTSEGGSMSITEGSGDGHSLLNMDLPIFMNCPYCKNSDGGGEKQEGLVYAGCVSQLQRIFMVTPPFPLILATQAVVEFEGSPSSSSSKRWTEKQGVFKPFVSAQEREEQEQGESSSASEVVLPPDSFLVLRLPFVYHTKGKDLDRKSLIYQKDAPERTAWLVKGTALRVLSKGMGPAGPAP